MRERDILDGWGPELSREAGEPLREPGSGTSRLSWPGGVLPREMLRLAFLRESEDPSPCWLGSGLWPVLPSEVDTASMDRFREGGCVDGSRTFSASI